MTRLLLAAIAAFLLNATCAAGDPAAAQAQPLKGEVLEVKEMDAYTYLRLKTKDGELWAAVNKAPVKKGAQVTIENPMMMRNFESKALKKTFDKIVFGTLAGTGASSMGGHAGDPHGRVAQAPDVADVAVPKAQGPDARTVAEIYGKRTELKDKPVLIRGKVVKVTSAVMGKNWLHLRDGSGSPKDGTNDVLVTTKEEAKVGSIVLAKGVVRTDVDLGSGYAYKVLVEDATLQK
ncbi:MAG TPA: nucleotide-binding protein [Burkholderiales bacterium]|nr:nucleotide-binding protein [Burkholderiales bacterium]